MLAHETITLLQINAKDCSNIATAGVADPSHRPSPTCALPCSQVYTLKYLGSWDTTTSTQPVLLKPLFNDRTALTLLVLCHACCWFTFVGGSGQIFGPQLAFQRRRRLVCVGTLQYRPGLHRHQLLVYLDRLFEIYLSFQDHDLEKRRRPLVFCESRLSMPPCVCCNADPPTLLG